MAFNTGGLPSSVKKPTTKKESKTSTADRPTSSAAKQQIAATPVVNRQAPAKQSVRPTDGQFRDASSEPEIRLTARVPKSFKTKVKVMCAQDNVSVSGYITQLIEDDLRKRGEL